MRLRKGPFQAALVAGVFVLCGLLRVLTYQMDLLDGFSQLLAGALLLIWTIEVQTRVTDRRLQRLILNLYHVVPAIAGVKLWLESDCFTFAMMAYLEACIRIGLIPANTGYGPLFSRLEEIEALSRQAPQDFMKTLPRLCLLTAYVKRRCNMELLSEDGSLPLEELEAALTESLEYLKLNGVENALSFTGGGRLPAGLVISAYEHLHVLASDALDAMQSLVLRVCGAAASEGEAAFLELRLLLRTRHPSWDFAWPVPGISAPQPRVQFSVEGRDLCLVLRFEEGGGKA